jgi:hypothetical protein
VDVAVIFRGSNALVKAEISNYLSSRLLLNQLVNRNGVLMKKFVTLALILSSLVVAACGKKSEQTASSDAAPAPAEQSTAPAPPAAEPSAESQAEPSADAEERAKKQGLLDYATMEDNYIQDPHAQWASTGKASSTFGDDNGKQPAASNSASNVAGPVDGNSWTNNKQDIGLDWLEAGFAKPVYATEVRIVFPGGEGVEAVSKLELQDTQGNWNTVWSGLSDVKEDRRGRRTWFVKSFEKTKYQVNAIKVTIANNVQSGYKVIDAAQLVGE